MSSIPYVNLSAQWHDERHKLLPILERVMSSGQYVGGQEVERFEVETGLAFGAKHIIALNSGTDALVCGLVAIGVRSGDEVITPPNSFVASTAAIVHLRARPVFVDIGCDQNIDPGLIERSITKKTKAIMPVHLAGRMAAMEAICEIADRNGVTVLEDAAQAAGSSLHGKSAGLWGQVGCFSAHPLKNLNACGDAGFVATNDSVIAQRIRSMRNHGLVNRDTVERFGYVSRMDAVQAAILRYRLSVLHEVIRKRKNNVKIYRANLNSRAVYCPPDTKGEDNSWHTFVIQTENRDELRKYLSNQGIETAIHYPIPIHLQPAASDLGYQNGDFPETERQATRILTLPVHQYLRQEQIETIVKAINNFFGS